MVSHHQEEFDTHIFRDYKKHKEYRQNAEEQIQQKQNPMLIEENYFNCIFCGKVNLVQLLNDEGMKNRTMRARYLTWKKFKDISNEKGGTLENGLNYLISLHEGLVPKKEDYIGIAGFGGGDEKKKR